MTLDEAKMAKQEAENKIQTILTDLIGKTGMNISDLSYEDIHRTTISSSQKKQSITKVHIEMKV